MWKPLRVFIEKSKYNSLVLDCAICANNQNTPKHYIMCASTNASGCEGMARKPKGTRGLMRAVSGALDFFI